MVLFTNKINGKVQNLSWSDSDTLSKLESIIALGRVFAAEGDTVLGLFSLASQDGYDKLNAIKNRKDKPYVVLVDNECVNELTDDLKKIHIESLIAKNWPGPLTIIVNAKKSVPEYMKSKDGAIALRVPNHKHLLDLIGMVGPLFSTSANKAGQPIPERNQDLDPALLDQINAIVTGDTVQTVPSTIVDCRGDSCKVIRQGAVRVA